MSRLMISYLGTKQGGVYHELRQVGGTREFRATTPDPVMLQILVAVRWSITHTTWLRSCSQKRDGGWMIVSSRALFGSTLPQERL